MLFLTLVLVAGLAFVSGYLTCCASDRTYWRLFKFCPVCSRLDCAREHDRSAASAPSMPGSRRAMIKLQGCIGGGDIITASDTLDSEGRVVVQPEPVTQSVPSQTFGGDGLCAFLLARIADDGRDAERCRVAAPNDRPSFVSTWARDLAECEAKRRIVGALSEIAPAPHDSLAGMFGADACRYSLATLAAVYADHPDYEEAWRP